MKKKKTLKREQRWKGCTYNTFYCSVVQFGKIFLSSYFLSENFWVNIFPDESLGNSPEK